MENQIASDDDGGVRDTSASDTTNTAVISITDLQSHWQIPCITQFCGVFQEVFDLPDFTFEDLENALLYPSGDMSWLLLDLQMRLMKGAFNARKLSEETLDQYIGRAYSMNDMTCPLDEVACFNDLSVEAKLDMILFLCHFRVDREGEQTELRNLEAECLRASPIGQDSSGNSYWYFFGSRLYKEEAVQSGQPPAKRSRGRRKGNTEEASAVEHDPLKTERGKWSVHCSTLEDWKQFIDQIKKSTSSKEKALHATLKRGNFLVAIEEVINQEKKERQRQLVEAIPRRQSTRIEALNKQREDKERERQAEIERTAALRKNAEYCLRSMKANLESQIGKFQSLCRDNQSKERAARAKQRQRRLEQHLAAEDPDMYEPVPPPQHSPSAVAVLENGVGSDPMDCSAEKPGESPG